MATLEEIIRKRKETEGKGNTTTLERILVERNLRTHGNNSKAIKGYNDWIGRVNASRDKYIEDAKSRADVYQPSELFSGYANDTDAEIRALAAEGQKYREHFQKYGDLYGADMANKIRSGVDDVDSYLHDLSVGLGAERRYWEGFTDLEDFNTKRAAAEAAKKEAEEYAANKEKYKAYDFAAGEEKATYLKGIAERLADIASKERGDGNTLVGGGLPTFRERRETADREREVVYQELRSRYPELADYDLTELNNYIAQLGDEIEGGKSFLELDKFSNYGNPRSEYYDPNFEQYAKYDPSRLDRISYLNDGFNEKYDPYAIAYHYINSSEDVKHDIMNRYANANGGDTNINVIQMRDWLVDLNNMSEEQKKNFNYLYSYTPRYAIPRSGEKRRVERYTEYILPEIENIAEYKFGKAHPFLASLLSMAYTPLSGVEVVADTAKYLGNVLIDPNNAKMDSNSFAGDKGILGQGVSDTVDWNIGGWDAFDFLYNTGMSGVDSAVASFIPGGYMLLGLSEAANGVNDGLERGMSDGQALANGVFRGIFEALFEKISIGNLDSMKSLKPKTLKQFGKEMVKSMGVNASEEALTEIANITYDIIVNGELSQLQQLVGSGKSYLEAIGELGLQVLESGASGALMGMGFSGAASGVNAAVNTFKQNKIGKGIVADGKAQDYISRGLEMPDTKAFKYAEAAKAKLDKGKSANVRIGKLAQNLSDSQMISSFRSQLGEKSGDIAETLTDLVKGREVSNKAIRSILQNETALSMLNESFGTSLTADSKVEDVNEGIKKGFETPKTERDKIVDTLKKNVDSKGVNAYADTIEALQRGEVVSDKEINAFLKNPQALAALNEITGETFTKKSTTNTVRKAMVKDNMSRPGQALMFGTTLDIGENGLKGLVSVANHSSGSMANIAQAYNAIYQAAKQGKAITDAKNPYLAELNAAQKLIAYEYGVMDSLEKKAEEEKLETSWTKEETENKADKKVDEAVEDTVPEGGEKLKSGEVVVPVKEMTKEQSDLVEAGKKLGIEVIVASIKKQGKNIDGLYNGKALYVNPDPTSGNPLVTILKHELTHFLEKNTKNTEYSTFATAVTDSKAFHKWLKDKGFKNTQEYLAEIVRNYKLVGKNYAETDPEPHGEMIANFVGDVLFAEDNSLERFVNELTEEKKKTFGDFIRDFINWIKGIFGKTDEVRMLEKKYAELFGSEKVSAKQFVQEAKDTQYNFALAESHRDKLAEKYTSSAAVDVETIRARYDKILEIWKRIGGQLDSKFLNEWNSKKVIGNDRAFTIFKAQSGYKYNVELSSMCKKGVPLFEAIDTIVKEEAMKELKVDKLGKAEKEILYDLLKSDGFDIPCAICYVEQARQREGVIIDAFLNGSEDGKVGWNQVLRECEEKMRAVGVDYKFPALDRSVATDKYVARKLTMTEAEQDAFYKALKEIANREIKKYNDSHQSDKKFKPRKLVTSLTPDAIADCFKGNISSDLKIFKVLFLNPNSRFSIESDLLYASTTTHNLAYAHQNLYSLFNQQGGVSGYKTKQSNVVYWGDILEKKWEASKLRKEGGIRYQSNSDSQMYTLLDQVQMFIDLTAKGYYLQSYSKVLSYLKLLGLSKGKINASLIPKVVVYRNADSSVDFAKTQENAGLDENGKPIYDDIEGIDHKEAFMLIEDPDYSRSVGGVCIGYSDNHIRALLDDSRIQLIIGFHDKTNNPDKRYRGARYSKNYNGVNEAVDSEGKTVHIGFNQFVQQAEKMFTKSGENFTGTATYNGKEYKANDIPRLAADLYLEMCAKKGYKPAYNIEGIVDHPNYYKLLADFSLYDSKGNYAPHQKVEYNMPDQVPYLDENGHKRYMKSETYIRTELEKELKVRDDIAEKLADKSEAGLIPRFIKAVNGEQIADTGKMVEEDDDSSYSFTPSQRDTDYLDAVNRGDMETAQRMVDEAAKDWGAITNGNTRVPRPLHLYHGTGAFGFTRFHNGRIYATTAESVASGYNRGRGLGRVRSSSLGYIPNDGTVDTAIKNAKNVLGAELTKLDDAKKRNIISKADNILKGVATKVAELDEVTDYGKAGEFFEYLTEKYGEDKAIQWTNDLDSLHYMLAAEYTVDEIMENGEWLVHDLKKYPEWKQSLSELWTEEREAIKNATLDKVFSYLLGYEYGDALIDIEFGLGRLLDNKQKLVNANGSLVYLEDIIDGVEMAKDTGIYDLYGHPGDKPLIIDEGKRFWDAIPFENGFRSTDYIVKWAKEHDYTSVLFKTVLDPSSGGSANIYADEWVFFDSNQVKSADPVTYDDNGNVIPLSERFNPDNDDVRYSYTPPKAESEDYAERSVIASFLGKKGDSVREIVLNFVHDGVYDARNQGRDNWGEYSWTINSHAYGPYAELSIYNNLSGNVLVKSAPIDKRNDVTSKISSYIIDDALKIIRDYPNVKVVKKEKPNPNSIPKNVTTSKISNAVPSTTVTDKIPKARPKKSIDTKEERISALVDQFEGGLITREQFEEQLIGKDKDDPISNARLTEEDATTTPDIKRKTGEVKGDGERDTVISKGRADIFSEEFKKEVETDDFIQKYKTITNEETLRTAADELDREGNEGVQNWLALKPERASVVDIVKGFILLDRYRRLGHIEGQVRVAQKISDMGTAAGQAVQSFTILRRLDAAAMLAYSQRSLDNALKAMSKARGEIWLKKNADRFKLNDEDIDFILNRSILATTLPDGRDKDILISQIAQRIQDKLPPEKGDSAKALQRISMLFNPKTIIRNVAGNVSVAPVHYVSDWIGTAADALIGKKTGVRTTSVFTPVGENAKAFARGAYESFDDFRKKVNTQANLDRFDVRSAHGKAFDEHGKARRLAQALNAMDRLTSFALAVGDRPFYEYWFTRSINAQKRTNKVAVPTAEMIEIATQEALQRTWQDDNGFTKFVGNLKRVLNTVNIKGYGLGDVLIKFTKTPANIAKAIYDLSPLAAISVTKNAVALNRAIKSGKDVAVAQKTFVKSFSNAVAGTMLYALMIALFNAGLLTGGSDDDKDVAAFEKWVQGVPSYSINLGGRWFSYEWVQPIGAAAAIVSDFMEAKEVGTGAWDSIVLALKSGGNVFTNQSFLQSFQRLFSADTLWDGVLDTLLSDPSAWVPQILSQFANLFDDKRRVTYDKASPLRTFYNSFAYKIPGLRNTLTEDVDVFGRTIPNSQANIGNAFFNPANTYVDTSDDVTSHVYELYKALGDKAMIPAKAPYSITVGKESIPLTAEERAEYQRIMGGVSYHIIEQLIKSDFYNSYTDDEKDTVIRAVYSYASKVAQASYKADYTYDMALKDNIYMTRAIYDAMSDEDKQQAYHDGVMKSYAEILNADEKGLVTFFELKGVKDAVLNATIEYDSAKAIELMETAIEKSSAYADKEEEEKAIRSGIRSTLTSYWKPHYKVANYENDREEMDRILNVLTETGLYGNRYETRHTIQKWLEEEE